MNWNEVQRIFKIEVEIENHNFNDNPNMMKVKCYVPFHNKTGHYTFNQSIFANCMMNGVSIDSIIQSYIIRDFELEKWIGEEIKITNKIKKVV